MDKAIKNARLLIVDDESNNVFLLEDLLRQAEYIHIRSTTDPRTALACYLEFEPDLILLDLMMPHLDGFQVMQQLRPRIAAGVYLPILVLTADPTSQTKRKALAAGANDFLTKPIDVVEVLLRIRNLLESRFLHLELREQNATLEQRVRERTEELEEAQVEMLERLAQAAEFRDDETGKHTQRVGVSSALVAARMDFGADTVALIRRAAPLHDLGKIGIPDRLLRKKGPLLRAEFEQIKLHAIIGAAMLARGHSELVRMAERIALSHHERWDGTGYPRGLSGEQIPVEGRVVAVADLFDALMHARPYKLAWPLEEALAEILRQSGRQLDPRVVEAFLSLSRETVEGLQ